MYILHVKCHLPYKSAVVYFDSHGGRGGGRRKLVAKGSEYLIIVSAVPVSLSEHVTCTSSMSNVIFLINLPVCTLIAMGSEYLIIVSAVLVSLLEHITCTSFMSNVIFLINLLLCTLIAIGGGGCI